MERLIATVGRRGGSNTFARRRRLAPLALAVLAMASCRAAGETSDASEGVAALLEALQSGVATAAREASLGRAPRASKDDPSWPTLAYLTGELQLRRNAVAQARETFRGLVSWASAPPSHPYDDGWGRSGLAALALWRWLQILDSHGGGDDEIDQALRAASVLMRTRLFVGMVHTDLLPSLPLLEEDIARLLSHVAWKAQRPEATSLFLDFVEVDSTGVYHATSEAIHAAILDQALATPQRLELFRLRRQLSLVRTAARKQVAAQGLWELWNDQAAPPDVRAEAGYEWSAFNRRYQNRKKDVVAVLTSVLDLDRHGGATAEKALYLRGMVHNAVDPTDPDAFLADMTQLLDLFPERRFADDALYQLASEYLFAPQADLNAALSYLERLRAFKGPNDWLDSAYFLAAVGLVDRRAAGDYEAADRLLADYVERFADGPFRHRCLFWRGRVAELGDNRDAARAFYEQVVREAPFDYYGLRARMHLEGGATASQMALPHADSQTSADLRRAYRAGRPEQVLAESTPYHERLRAAETSGVFAQLLPVVNGLGSRFRSRLDSISLDDLDRNHLIPVVGVLLSLRQDALAARDVVPTADNSLRLAGFLGHGLKDWPTALAMTLVRPDAPRRRLSDLQNDPRYLATIYPPLDVLDAIGAAVRESAWPVDGSSTLPESLMYAIAGRESRYFAGAISPAGALGLFQIMPSTFEGRRECWRIRDGDPPPRPSSYLFDPARNAQFWACWVATEFPLRSRGDVFSTLLKHHAGRGTLDEWRESWKGRALENDLELQLDTLRFPATRLFVRSVLNDVAIVEASNLVAASSGGDRREP